jgi:integrase
MPRKSKYHRRPDGRLEHTVLIDGKRKHFYGQTDADIDKQLLEYTHKVEVGKTFGEVLNEWKAWHDDTVSVGTNRAYLAPTKDALARFGDSPIKDITAKEIKAVLAEMARKDYSIKTIKKYYTIYRSVFDFAAENDYIDNNVARNVTMPKFAKPVQKRQAATEQEEQTIKANVDKWLLPYFLLYTGMRKGEALAIQFKDIDRENKVIRVYKSVAYKYNTPYIKEPKTAAGIRTIPLLDALADVLPTGKDDHFLFSGEKPMSMMVFQRRWARYQKETGIKCTAHQLRHSFATMLYDADIDVKQAQYILGHASEQMTRDVYTHIRDSKRQSAADTLNAFIAKK